jgi:Uncharacterized protein conserved in bacteria
MRLLLHTCCAPCSAAIIEYLLQNEVVPTLFFFNPNIFPKEEYLLREKECIHHAQALGLEIINSDYDHTGWLNEIQGLEKEPERGARCLKCFKLRMVATARLASEKGFDTIATTLASSRWKSLDQISEAGQWAIEQFPGITFWDKNWRKDGLSERRKILLREYGFYNQHYCGCEFSSG